MTAATGVAEAEFMNEGIDPDQLESLRRLYQEGEEEEALPRIGRQLKQIEKLRARLRKALESWDALSDEARNTVAWSDYSGPCRWSKDLDLLVDGGVPVAEGDDVL